MTDQRVSSGSIGVARRYVLPAPSCRNLARTKVPWLVNELSEVAAYTSASG
jgi:hypothetical protein